MIGRLTGAVVHEEADGTVVLDVLGVGYEVATPLGTSGRLRALTPSGPVTLHVHTHVREDQFSLFGFATAADRTAFRTLLGVSSVGPKIALSILSAMPGDELARVIARKEIGRLTAVSGVGKKTAERLLLELRDKLPLSSESSSARAVAANESPVRDARALLIGALTSMGYKPAEAERAADQLGESIDDAPLADSIREALRLLAKK